MSSLKRNGLEELTPEIVDMLMAAVEKYKDVEAPNKSIRDFLDRARRLLSEVPQRLLQEARQIPMRRRQQAINGLRERTRSQLGSITDRLASGTITTEQWYREMYDRLRLSHLTAETIGQGGLPGLTPSARERASEATYDQDVFLRRWRRDIETGTATPDAGRANQYAESVIPIFERARQTSLDMPELPAQPKDGTTDCHGNCKCRWEVKTLEGAGNWDVYWKMGEAEHCRQCPRRERAWNPIRIRDGEIENTEVLSLPGLFI